MSRQANEIIKLIKKHFYIYYCYCYIILLLLFLYLLLLLLLLLYYYCCYYYYCYIIIYYNVIIIIIITIPYINFELSVQPFYSKTISLIFKKINTSYFLFVDLGNFLVNEDKVKSSLPVLVPC